MRFIQFDGIDSRDMGLYIDDTPPAPMPDSAMTEQVIAGRDGYVLTGSDTRQTIIQQVDGFVSDLTRMPAIRAWLRTGRRGKLIVSDDAGHAMEAAIINGISFQHYTVRTAAFTVMFSCQPWLYLVPEGDDITVASGDIINNPGTAPAAAKYTITGTGDAVVMIGGKSITIEGLDGGIVIDTDAQVATSLDGVNNRMGTITGDPEALMILAGRSVISWTGAITSIVISPRWRDY